MDSYTIAGLPLHVLINHVVVIFVPLTALAIVLHAVWPAAARRLGVVTPLAGLVVLVTVPITIEAGKALERAVTITPAVQQHADLGPTLLPWAIAVFVIAFLLWAWTRFVRPSYGERMPVAARTGIAVVLAVAAVIIAVGSVIDVVLIGDAGARAVWGSIVGG